MGTKLINAGQLAQWAGIVTAYVGDFQGRPKFANLSKCIIGAYEQFMPHAKIWSPLLTDDHSRPISRTVAVGDAGMYDDLGHLPLLRRGVKKLVIVDSSAVHDKSSGVDQENLCQMVYTRAAFGQPGCLRSPSSPPGAPFPTEAAGFTTVFEPSEFARLWSQILELHAAGRPVVVRGEFSVVDNMRFGIKGGWKAEIV